MIAATELEPVLSAASTLIARDLGADKVDVFLHDAASDSLVARGTMDSPMARRQRATGLDRLPLASGGLTVIVFRTGGSYLAADVDRELDARRDIVRTLGVRSLMLCRLDIGGTARGVLQAASAERNRFSAEDLRFLETVAAWVGALARRAELVERITKDALEEGRRLAAEDLHRLTRREQEVAALVASGLTNDEIAVRLILAQGTVANHVEHILRKLGFSRRSQIATWAVDHGLWSSRIDQNEL